MKKTYILGLIASLCFAACTPEVDDVFGASSAERIDETLKADSAVLVSPADGWLMEYYPAKGMTYGGYNVLVKFGTDGQVTVASDIVEDPDKTAVSTYRLKEQAGPVLSFDTYNEIFHIFSDPANKQGIGNTGVGMEGDYEFTILSAAADKVVLEGKKTGNKITMTPFAGGTWKDYLDKVQKQYDQLKLYFRFSYEIPGASYEVSHSNRNLTITYTTLEGEEMTITEPYIVTPDGLKFYEPVELFGYSASALNKDGNADRWVSEDGGVTLQGKKPTEVDVLLNYGPWYMTWTEMGESTQEQFAAKYPDLFVEGENSYFKGQQLKYVAIGANLVYTNYGITFVTDQYKWDTSDEQNVAKCVGMMELGYSERGSNQVGLTLTGTGTEGGDAMYKSGILGWLSGFGSYVVFKLETDNVLAPTWVKLTDVNDTDNWFKIVKEKTEFGYVYVPKEDGK